MGPDIQYVVSVIWCNSCLTPFNAGQVLNWSNNCQEVILLITSNGFAPVSPRLSNPICRAKLLRRQHSEHVQPTAGNAKRQMVKHNRTLRLVFVQGRDPILRCLARWQFPTGKEATPASSSVCLDRLILILKQILNVSYLLFLVSIKD